MVGYWGDGKLGEWEVGGMGVYNLEITSCMIC